jgi:hypothetical protein
MQGSCSIQGPSQYLPTNFSRPEAKPDDVAIQASIDFNISISAVMENASDLDLFRTFITKQMKLRMGVQGALVYGVKLMGKEGALALAFPSLAKQILDDRGLKEGTNLKQPKKG